MNRLPPRTMIEMLTRSIDTLTQYQPVIEKGLEEGRIDKAYLRTLMLIAQMRVLTPKIDLLPDADGKGAWSPIMAFALQMSGKPDSYNLKALVPSITRRRLEALLKEMVQAVKNGISTLQADRNELIQEEAERKRKEELAAQQRATEAQARRAAEENARNELWADDPEALTAILSLIDGTNNASPTMDERIDADGRPHYTQERFIGVIGQAIKRNTSKGQVDFRAIEEGIWSAVEWGLTTIARKKPGEYTANEIEELTGDELIKLISDKLIELAGVKANDAVSDVLSRLPVLKKSIFESPRPRVTSAMPAARMPTSHSRTPKPPVRTEHTNESPKPTEIKPVDPAFVQTALEEITKLRERDGLEQALLKVAEARKIAPNDPDLLKMRTEIEHALRMEKQRQNSTDLSVGTMKPVAPKNKQDGDKKGKKGKKGRDANAS